jgi:hypothetical protein
VQRAVVNVSGLMILAMDNIMVWLDPTIWAWIFFLSEWVIRLGMLAVIPFRCY